MPPRVPLFSLLGQSNLCLRPAVQTSQSGCSLSVTSIAHKSSSTKQRRHRDPWAEAQARQRKAVNVERQAQLRQQRKDALGDPVRGVSTPFVESFDTATALNATADASSSSPSLNHFLKPTDLERSIQHSYILTQPIIATKRDSLDPVKEEEDIKMHAEGHERAAEAIARIVSLRNGNSKDRTRANVQRCIETFGRHNTDSILQPRAPSLVGAGPNATPPAEKTPRAGPDTGSSEVQVAILTAKIRVLAKHLDVVGHKDKVNKRNLRLLVHRRQKLLAYLRKKERGGERWTNLIETLGLTEGTWKGEISL